MTHHPSNEERKEGTGAYNLACLASLNRKAEESREWLAIAKNAGTLPDAEHLSTDSDLDFVRSESWFEALLEPTPAAD